MLGNVGNKGKDSKDSSAPDKPLLPGSNKKRCCTGRCECCTPDRAFNITVPTLAALSTAGAVLVEGVREAKDVKPELADSAEVMQYFGLVITATSAVALGIDIARRKGSSLACAFGGLLGLATSYFSRAIPTDEWTPDFDSGLVMAATALSGVSIMSDFEQAKTNSSSRNSLVLGFCAPTVVAGAATGTIVAVTGVVSSPLLIIAAGAGGAAVTARVITNNFYSTPAPQR